MSGTEEDAGEESPPADARAWVSVDPYGADRGSAYVWCLHLNRSGEVIGHYDALTKAAGWSALAELDSVLTGEGFARTAEWQLGRGRGYVAWIEQMEMAL